MAASRITNTVVVTVTGGGQNEPPVTQVITISITNRPPAHFWGTQVVVLSITNRPLKRRGQVFMAG